MMAWFQCDPSKVKKLRKFRDFRVALQWSINEALGFLCSFWGEVAELNESGEISDWTPEYLAELTNLGKLDPRRVWETMVTTEWIDVKDEGRALVRDWIDIAGPYLRDRYHAHNRHKLVQIWGLHGRIYGRESRSEKGTTAADLGGPEPPGQTMESEPASRSLPIYSKREVNGKSLGSETERGSMVPHSPPYSPKSKGILINPSGSSAAADDDKIRPEVTLLIKLYRERQTKRLAEPPAKFNFGAAGKGFKELLQIGYTIQDIEVRFNPWFKSDKQFVLDRSFCVEDFFTHFNKLKDGPIANQVGTNGKQSFYDGAATITEEAVVGS